MIVNEISLVVPKKKLHEDITFDFRSWVLLMLFVDRPNGYSKIISRLIDNKKYLLFASLLYAF